ncbi:hypothetical protein PMZ80_008849 [Knufia obscura]|uniref:Uncharacterized protein n=2 Tax=Knufia TaxID=430999 RepID=A0AAN8IA60_9EURO|nr:hypothetical protein PMZ80_008849 [Knufia obscura]KAK5955190.1 hypothetical protein OHC33_003870 [Knufia fluminis]
MAATAILFNNAKLDAIVTGTVDKDEYLKGSFIAVLHQEHGREAPAPICDTISEALVRELWPGCKIGEGIHGRAFLLQYAIDRPTIIEVFVWLKASVEKGAFQDLSNYTWGRNAFLVRMRGAASTMGIDRLTTVVNAAFAAGIPDAAQTVQH